MKKWANYSGILSSSFLRAEIAVEKLFPLYPLESSIATLHTVGIISFSVNMCCLLRNDPKGSMGYKEHSTVSQDPWQLLAEGPWTSHCLSGSQFPWWQNSKGKPRSSGPFSTQFSFPASKTRMPSFGSLCRSLSRDGMRWSVWMVCGVWRTKLRPTEWVETI